MSISASVRKRLRTIAKKNKIRPSSLTKVYRRGLGASLGSGARKGISSSGWAMARVNSFVKIVKGRKSIKHDPVLARAERKRRKKR
jgi:hypothetical protein